MIRRFILTLALSGAATIGGTIFGMHTYLNSVNYPVAPDQMERSYWIAGFCGAFGAVGGSTGVLIAFLLTAEKSDRQKFREYAQAQLKRSDLSASESAAWTEIAGAIEASNQPKKFGLGALFRSIW